MADKNNIAGRGKPVYLLDRVKYESSIGSNYGISRIFNRTASTTTSVSSDIFYTSSLLRDSSTCGKLSAFSDFAPNSCEYKSSSKMSSIYDELVETRTI
jgi:hypothetical protein